MIFGDFPTDLRKTCGKYCVNSKEISWNFRNQLVLDVFLMKFRKTSEEILKKFKRNWVENFKLF